MSKHLSPRAERPALWRRIGSVRLRAFFALGVLGVAGATGTTFAAWTDSAAITGTTMTAGTIDLKLNADLDSISGYTSLNIANMVPGNSVATTVLVKNKGTAPLKYTLASSVTNADGKGLGTALTYTVTTATAVTGTSPSATCGGTTIATGTLGGTMVGTGRLLAASTGTETICVAVSLPSGANTSLQGATTNVTLTFTGTSDLA